MLTLTLPCICPVLGCKTWLQRRVDPAEGVDPHFVLMHPGVEIPEVAV